MDTNESKPTKPTKPVRLTVDLGSEELYRLIRIAAIQKRQPVRELVVGALWDWIRSQEDLFAAAELDGAPESSWPEVRELLDSLKTAEAEERRQLLRELRELQARRRQEDRGSHARRRYEELAKKSQQQQ